MYSVTLTATSSAGCSQSFTINNYVDAHPQTTAYFTTTPKFTTLAEPHITFDAITGDTSWTYNWTFGDGYSAAGQNTTHDYTQVDKYQVCLYTTNVYNCSDTLCDSVDVRSDFSFYVPNVFTPNNDMVNEVFTPMGRSFQDYDLTILDRWGRTIFRSKDIRFSWDGKLSSGELAPVGVYVYVIDLRDLDGLKHEFIGNVALIR
jgi:gliding motility-associated-like protein